MVVDLAVKKYPDLQSLFSNKGDFFYVILVLYCYICYISTVLSEYYLKLVIPNFNQISFRQLLLCAIVKNLHHKITGQV